MISFQVESTANRYKLTQEHSGCGLCVKPPCWTDWGYRITNRFEHSAFLTESTVIKQDRRQLELFSFQGGIVREYETSAEKPAQIKSQIRRPGPAMVTLHFEPNPCHHVRRYLFLSPTRQDLTQGHFIVGVLGKGEVGQKLRLAPCWTMLVICSFGDWARWTFWTKTH